MRTDRGTDARRTRCGIGAVLALGAGVAAQPVNPDRPALDQPFGVPASRFSKVEQTVGDVDPLGVSIRNLQTDLRQPMGFRDVFRIQGSSRDAAGWGIPNPTGGDLFARMDGAITAVFPQSVYINTRNGMVPLVPPGTVFFIGALPFDRFGAATCESPTSPDWVDTRVDTRVGTAPAVPAAGHITDHADQREVPSSARRDKAAGDRAGVQKPPPAPSPSIMTDEPLRRKTVRELIMRAADTKKGDPDRPGLPDGHIATKAAPEKTAAPVAPGRP